MSAAAPLLYPLGLSSEEELVQWIQAQTSVLPLHPLLTHPSRRFQQLPFRHARREVLEELTSGALRSPDLAAALVQNPAFPSEWLEGMALRLTRAPWRGERESDLVLGVLQSAGYRISDAVRAQLRQALLEGSGTSKAIPSLLRAWESLAAEDLLAIKRFIGHEGVPDLLLSHPRATAECWRAVAYHARSDLALQRRIMEHPQAGRDPSIRSTLFRGRDGEFLAEFAREWSPAERALLLEELLAHDSREAIRFLECSPESVRQEVPQPQVACLLGDGNQEVRLKAIALLGSLSTPRLPQSEVSRPLR